MAKTEVYSWRISPRLKSKLEEVAQAERKSMAVLLEEIAEDWLERSKGRDQDDEEQERVRAAAMRFVGTIQGGQSQRAENARSEVRSRIARRHER
jgi:predicted transcriptional regulator